MISPNHGKSSSSQQISVATESAESDPSSTDGVDSMDPLDTVDEVTVDSVVTPPAIVIEEEEEPEPEAKRKLNKFEKKMNKLAGKYKDLREQAFLAMASGRMLEKKGLYDFVDAMMKSSGMNSPEMSLVTEFFELMKPNNYGQVSFSQFQRAIDIDGDVVRAYNAFLKDRKKDKVKRRKSKRNLNISPR